MNSASDLITLLTFPSVSDGFAALRSGIHDNHTTLPSLPLSKVARLDADSDSGSASRSRAGVHPTSRTAVAGDPVRIFISGSLREWCYSCDTFQSAEFDPLPSQTSRTTSDWVAFTPPALYPQHSHSRLHRSLSTHIRTRLCSLSRCRGHSQPGRVARSHVEDRTRAIHGSPRARTLQRHL